jgi:hypothetical protein
MQAVTRALKEQVLLTLVHHPEGSAQIIHSKCRSPILGQGHKKKTKTKLLASMGCLLFVIWDNPQSLDILSNT